jgi:hypothetical protein
MPGRSQYPTGADLEAYLIAAGFDETFVESLPTDIYAAAGVSQFERDADRQMLAVTGTREFDPQKVTPSGLLDLEMDLAALTSVAWSSTSYTVGTDVRGFPLNATNRGQPYSALSFGLWRRFYRSSYPLLPALITVTGDWGFAAEIPDDAWLGMLAVAGRLLLPQIIHQRTGGMESWTEADMTERYGTKPMEALSSGWQGVALATAGGITADGKRIWGKYTRFPMPV